MTRGHRACPTTPILANFVHEVLDPKTDEYAHIVWHLHGNPHTKEDGCRRCFERIEKMRKDLTRAGWRQVLRGLVLVMVIVIVLSYMFLK